MIPKVHRSSEKACPRARPERSSSTNSQSGMTGEAKITLPLTSAPGGLVLLLVVTKGVDKAAQHLRRGLEHGLELGLVDVVDILAQMVDRLLETLLHFLRVMNGIALACARHAGLHVDGRKNGAEAASGVAQSTACPPPGFPAIKPLSHGSLACDLASLKFPSPIDGLRTCRSLPQEPVGRAAGPRCWRFSCVSA